MFEHLIRLSLRYRNLTLGLAIALLWGGLQAWLTLPIDAFPDISPTQAKVILKIPGMTPALWEQMAQASLQLFAFPNFFNYRDGDIRPILSKA